MGSMGCGVVAWRFGDKYWESGNRENYNGIDGVSASLGCASLPSDGAV